MSQNQTQTSNQNMFPNREELEKLTISTDIQSRIYSIEYINNVIANNIRKLAARKSNIKSPKYVRFTFNSDNYLTHYFLLDHCNHFGYYDKNDYEEEKTRVFIPIDDGVKIHYEDLIEIFKQCNNKYDCNSQANIIFFKRIILEL